MNWKQVLFWSLSAALLFYYLLVMGVFTWSGQEEAQLFIPRWWAIKDTLFEPGGFCSVVGQWIVQHYRKPMLAVIIHTSMLIGCGVMVSRLLRGSSTIIRNSLISLMPILYLASMSVRSEYLVDGTVGLLLMLMALSFAARIRNVRLIAGYGITTTLILCILGGYLSLYYAILYTILALLNQNQANCRLAAASALIPALFILLFGGDISIPVPLWDGWRPEQFLEAQRLPHYYIYRVWTIFTIMLAALMVLSHLFEKLAVGGRLREHLCLAITILLLLLSLYTSLPNSLHLQRVMFDELAFLYREKQWDYIINRYRGREVNNYLVLNYINISLAQKGELGEKIFMFDQRGVKSLCSDWDQTFYMDRLLSDIYLLTGSISMSESYAMDGFAQAKRKGSASMMQRMVQISLLRGEMRLAKKYLDLLVDMPYYEDWARDNYKYLENPELMESNLELKGKRVPTVADDRLVASLPVDSLWGDCNKANNRAAWEYRGCYYLLEKSLEKFAEFISESHLDEGVALPRYFQEALMMVDDENGLFSSFSIAPEIIERYSEFKRMMKQSNGQVDISSIYRQFGDSYWFYYYFKNIKGEKR